MKYKIIKLDGRYSHRHRFSHMLEFYKGTSARSGVLDYDRACRWFNDHFGWSADVEVQHEMLLHRKYNPQLHSNNDLNEHWATSSKYNDYRIYVQSAKELEWFLLANPNEA